MQSDANISNYFEITTKTRTKNHPGIADANSHEYSYQMADFLADFVGTFAACYYAPIALRLVIELLVIVRKYGLVILRYLFFPVIVFYNFLSYLANKCKYKSEKYEKKSNDLNKE